MLGNHNLSDLQMDVMRVLWERGEATVVEVHDALSTLRGLATTTVATLLSRLARRGVVRHHSRGRQYIYSPAVSESEVRRSMVAELTDRLFHGDATALVSHLLTTEELDTGDLEKVRALLEDAGADDAKEGDEQ